MKVNTYIRREDEAAAQKIINSGKDAWGEFIHNALIVGPYDSIDLKLFKKNKSGTPENPKVVMGVNVPEIMEKVMFPKPIKTPPHKHYLKDK